MKTLNELADEYDSSIREIEEIVRKTRTAMSEAKKIHNIDEIKQLGAKLAILYEEIRDMRIVSQKLRTYYDEKTQFQEAI